MPPVARFLESGLVEHLDLDREPRDRLGRARGEIRGSEPLRRNGHEILHERDGIRSRPDPACVRRRGLIRRVHDDLGGTGLRRLGLVPLEAVAAEGRPLRGRAREVTVVRHDRHTHRLETRQHADAGPDRVAHGRRVGVDTDADDRERQRRAVRRVHPLEGGGGRR
jgi:hypothetical protein